jgi:hypothetical protein
MARQLRVVRVNDKMRRGYRYTITAPIGRSFDPEFCPELTPKEMLALGVFCGKYMTFCGRRFVLCRAVSHSAVLFRFWRFSCQT